MPPSPSPSGAPADGAADSGTACFSLEKPSGIVPGANTFGFPVAVFVV
jgi:hypothetical protein